MTWKRVVALVLLVLVVFAAGYIWGTAQAVRTFCAAEKKAAAQQAQQRGIPYPSYICDQCRENYPNWWCWLGGCP